MKPYSAMLWRYPHTSPVLPDVPMPESTEKIEEFARVQSRLPELFREVLPNPLAPRTVVVIPSLSLDQAELKDEKLVSRPVMPHMVEAQRRAAAAQGCAFYDTYTWQGGKGSALKWTRRGLVGTDFQHLSEKGSAMVADGLVEALLAGYAGYKAR